MGYGTITKWVMAILGGLDSAVYSIVSLVLNGLYNIAGTKIMTEGSITEFTDRIYVILGLFMLFKLAFSLLTGIVNPDKASDKQTGTSKMIVRVVITMSMLLMVPTIFEVAYNVQGNILMALPQVILGPNSSQDVDDVGKNITLTIMTAFVNPNEQCDSIKLTDENNGDKFENIWDYSDIVSRKCPNRSDEGKKIFKYRYTFLISTAVGIIMIVFLILTSIDVAIRTIKLSILQIVAPIPIMTYIDPKSEKDGAFGNWLKECVQAYISLFIQMGVVYVIIYLVSGIASDVYAYIDGAGNKLIQFPEGLDTLAVMWVFIFLVIGAFLFMKQAPKYIMKILGIKDGPGLGVGLSSTLAGVGALASGGGLAGALSATTTAMDEGMQANADGKSAFSKGGLQKGKEIASQITGKPMKSFGQKVTDFGKRQVAASYGVTKDSLKADKKAVFAEEARIKKANNLKDIALQRGDKNVDFEGKTYTIEDFSNKIVEMESNYGSLKDDYDKKKSFAKEMGGVGETSFQQNAREKMYEARKNNSTSTINGNEAGLRNNLPDLNDDEILQMMSEAQNAARMSESQKMNKRTYLTDNDPYDQPGD